MPVPGTPLPRAFKLDWFPIDRLDPGGDLMAFLSRILVTEYSETVGVPGGASGFQVGLSIAEELELGLIGLDGFALVLGGASTSTITFGLETGPAGTTFRLGAGARLRFPRSVLKPVIRDGEEWADDPSRRFAEIEIAAGVLIDEDWNVSFDGSNAFTLQPMMIADSGFVIEGQVALDLSETTGLPESAALGLPPTWKGVVFKAFTLHLPKSVSDSVPVANLQLVNFHIGSGGVTGTVRLNGAPGSAMLAGFPFVPTAFEVSFRENAFTGAHLAGNLTLPFFDAPVAVEAGFDLAGNITIGLTSTGGTGLLTLDKPGILALTLDGLAFRKEGEVFAIALSGRLQPKVAGLEWPTFRVQELSIDSKGQVRLEGGWLQLPEQYMLSFYGFQLSISAIGFGTETSGRRWIGFNGGLKLVDGLSAGASVEGMRIGWSPTGAPDISFSLDGVGVEFKVPGAVEFKGFVAMREPEPGVIRFDGDIKLKLIALNLEIDGQLVVGYNGPGDYTFFAVYIGVELPAGIPLWSTGLGLYGLAGLFALNMEPGRQPDEPWYAIQPGPSWYHRTPPGVGVANLRKWKDADGSLGIGAGITIGTVYDNGFTFSGKMLLAIVFPGPIIMIEGRANVLKERASLADDPMFRTLIVIDGRERSLLAGLDARYKIADDGELIEIAGSLEAYFDFDDLDAWYLNLGLDEPRAKRIGAEIFFHIFRANAYLMMNADRVKTGAWVGIQQDWTFGPLRVELACWMEGKAELSRKPIYLQGSLHLHGSLSVAVFGFGFGLSADAQVAAGVFDPFYIRADLSVSVNLPWPLPDFSVAITLEWGPEADPPLLPALVKEVAVAHEIVSATWPLAADRYLLPRIDDPANEGFFDNQPPGFATPDQPPPPNLPVVPLDARPDITFARPVHDDARAGLNPQPAYSRAAPAGWSWVGDASKSKGSVRVRPALTEVTLSRWHGTGWALLARAGMGANPAGVPRLYGAWMPTAAESGGAEDALPANVKLRVWTKTPYSFTSHTGSEWQTGFGQTYPGYPCVSAPPVQRVCCDFARTASGTRPAAPWSCADAPFQLTWPATADPVVETHDDSGGPFQALCFPAGATPTIMIEPDVSQLLVEVYRDDTALHEDCTDFADGPERKEPNPLNLGTMVLTAGDGSWTANELWFRDNGLPGAEAAIGLDCSVELRIDLAVPAVMVRLRLSTRLRRVALLALDAQGKPIDQTEVTTPDQQGDAVLTAREGDRIASVVIRGEEAGTTFLHQICSKTTTDVPVWMDLHDGSGAALKRLIEKDRKFDIPARGLTAVVLGRDHGSLGIRRVCAVHGPDTAYLESVAQMSQHATDMLSVWSTDGEVLPPWSSFRLMVTTELDVAVPAGSKVASAFGGKRRMVQAAYFQTEGPPVLGRPTQSGNSLVPGAGGVGASVPPAVETGLEDLARYVRQTVPATVPPEGKPPLLPRPVYRSYDVGVRFSTPYVDQMYAMSGRDLTLQIRDANDQPVRDAQGLLMSPVNRWGRGGLTSLSQAHSQWLDVLSGADCTSASINLGTVATSKTLTAPGHVLDPAAVYEARLIPLLSRESFDGMALGASATGSGAELTGSGALVWRVADHGTVAAPSVWTVGQAGTPPARHVVQSAGIYLGPAERDLPFPGGTLLIANRNRHLPAGDPAQPAAWTDIRLTLALRSPDDDIIGVGLRMAAGRGYLVTLDRQNNRRRIVRLAPAGAVVLAEEPGGYVLNSDVIVSAECVGPHIRVHFDGLQVFYVTDPTWGSGSIALYTADNAGARFADIRVEDLRRAAPKAYAFQFSTSAFANFRHQLLAGTGQSLIVALPPAFDLSPMLTAAVVPGSAAAKVPASEAEARAFASVAHAALGGAADLPVTQPEALRLANGGATAAVLLRLAEPVDWRRTRLGFEQGPVAPQPVAAGRMRIISASLGASDPAQESAGLILHEACDPAGCVIAARHLPSPGVPDLADCTLLAAPDLMTDRAAPVIETATLWTPQLVDTSEVEIVTPPGLGVPDWQGIGGTLSQLQDVFMPDPASSPPAMIGSFALARGALSQDLQIDLRVDLSGPGAAGVVFRFIDRDNFCSFMIDRVIGRRVLLRVTGGVATTVVDAALPFGAGASQAVRVVVQGQRVRIEVDGVAFGDTLVAGPLGGRYGLATWRWPQARFSGIVVNRLTRRLGELRIDETAPTGTPAPWAVNAGRLVRTGVPAATGLALALAEGGPWADLRLAAYVQGAGGAAPGGAGLVWRHVSSSQHIRFALAADGLSASLIRRVADADSVVWSGALSPPATLDTRYLVAEVIGRRVQLWVDGVLLAEVSDAGLGEGSAGLCGNAAAGFAAWGLVISHAVPQWRDWHVFGPTGHRTSGHRLRVTAGAASAGAVTVQGEEALWKGMAAAGFRPDFPAEGVDLRLTGLAGEVIDERRFLRAAAWAPLSVRMLRSGDGTAVVLLADGGGTLPAGQIRLTAEFRRDNQAEDADSIVLTEGGESLPETAVLTV